MSTAVRLVIVDDEPLALERLRGLVSSLENAVLVGTASGCESGLEAILRLSPDLALLDIKMRDGTAFDLLSRLPPDFPLLVAFATAYPRYACQAFEVNALDYLLKPVDRHRLEQTVERAAARRDLMSAAERSSELKRVVEQLREASTDDRVGYEKEIWIRRSGTEHVRVEISSINWIGALDDYVSIHVGTQEHLLRSSLDRIADILDPSVFARIHRSTIVRVEQVVKVTTSRTGSRNAILRDGTKLPIGRTYAKQLPWSGHARGGLARRLG